MKPISLILLFAFLHLATVTLAQDTGKRTHFGLSVTPFISSPMLDPDANTEVTNQFSWYAGGDFYFDLSGRTQLRSGLFVGNTKIAYLDYSPDLPGDIINGEFDPLNTYWDASYALVSLGIPLEIKFYLNQPETTNRFLLLGGVNFQYQISSTGGIDLVSAGQLVDQSDPEEAPFEAEGFRTSIGAGIGYEFLLGKGKCLISPGYEYGLTQLYSTSSSSVANVRPGGFGLRLAYYY